MKGFVLSSLASGDLLCIRADLEPQNPLYAGRFVRKLTKLGYDYARMPGMGIPRDDIGAGLRCFVVDRYLAIYRETPDGIQIARILHSARKITRAMVKDE